MTMTPSSFPLGPAASAPAAAPVRSMLRPALVLFCALSILTGLLYPLAITGLAQAVFPAQANGSLIVQEGRIVGSPLIGQAFSDPRHFWGRPSATAPMAYNAAGSSGSNQANGSAALHDAVLARIAALRAYAPAEDRSSPVPVDLVTASASGLDPHISAAAALYQIPRIAQARDLAPALLQGLVNRHTETPLAGFLGEARVNVLQLNLALDALQPLHQQPQQRQP